MPIAMNLRTGVGREPRPEDYFTKTTAVEPGGECPMWMRFLDEVTAGDVDLQSYLRRIAGYSMTGLTTEHVLFFLYGTGFNGKGVFLDTLLGVWNDYAMVAPMDMFVESPTDRHPTELAMLRGVRLVIAQEVGEGRHWDEAKLKALTGGDRIRARFMRQDFFEFVPKFKLMIAGNHKPSLRGVDEAIRRRIHLIPFTVTIPESRRDRDLAKKLRAEWPGILMWALGGCLEWQRVGLAPPDAVTAATENYLLAEDSFGCWIDERCVTGPERFGVGAHLWQSWRAWAEAAKEQTGTRKSFAQTLEARGYEAGKKRHERGYKGIDLDRIWEEPVR
jgi:putative DNA primase/helicase